MILLINEAFMEKINTKEATKKRLDEIEAELASLKEKHTGMKRRWENEKRVIVNISTLKEEIEKVKNQADQLERDGDLAKVAELRYGKIHELNKNLENAKANLERMQQEGKMLKEEVDAEDIAEIVSKWTGIPVSRMLESERIKLLKMEDRIHQRVISQEEAVSAVANAIRRSRAGLQDENRPIGSFIFLGTTGVGKTETARALAEFLFDDENAVIRMDMSEYMEKFSVSRLIGAPPGYVGYDEGGQLTEAIRQRPYSVVLLDEIEKAHTDVFNILLQLLDDGRLTDGKGRVVNFKNTIVIMTSNLGSEMIQDRLHEITDENRLEIMQNIRRDMIELLKKKMRPEFLNRIDEIVLFKPLTDKDIIKIAELQINRLKAKMKKSGMQLEISQDALEWLTKLGYDMQFGARPLKRAVQKHITDELAKKLLSGEFASGDKILVDTDNRGKFIFTKE